MSRQPKQKRETILHHAQMLMLSPEPAPAGDEIAQVDQVLRRVLAEDNPFLRQWIRFFDGVTNHAD